MAPPIKLRQAQVWKVGTEYFRIVRLERLRVQYKATTSLEGKEGLHVTLSKKEFCRLLKHARLVTANPPARHNPADAAEPAR